MARVATASLLARISHQADLVDEIMFAYFISYIGKNQWTDYIPLLRWIFYCYGLDSSFIHRCGGSRRRFVALLGVYRSVCRLGAWLSLWHLGGQYLRVLVDGAINRVAVGAFKCRARMAWGFVDWFAWSIHYIFYVFHRDVIPNRTGIAAQGSIEYAAQRRVMCYRCMAWP